MKDNLLSLLGLMRRASAIDYIEDECKKSISSGKSKLLICADDASVTLKQKMVSYAAARKISVVTLKYSKSQLSDAIGSGLCAFISVNDKGFADSLLKLIDKQ